MTHVTLADGDLIPIIVVGGGIAVAIIAIIAGNITSICRARGRERSRREIAAYIAEGSMTPDEGARLMAAGEKKDD